MELNERLWQVFGWCGLGCSQCSTEAAWQWFDCLTEPALLFHTSSQWPATGAYKTLASFRPIETHSLSCGSICLILLDLHGLLCYITFCFIEFDLFRVCCST